MLVLLLLAAFKLTRNSLPCIASNQPPQLQSLHDARRTFRCNLVQLVIYVGVRVVHSCVAENFQFYSVQYGIFENEQQKTVIFYLANMQIAGICFSALSFSLTRQQRQIAHRSVVLLVV